MVLGMKIRVVTEAGSHLLGPEDWVPVKQEARLVNVHRDLVFFDGGYRDLRESHFDGVYVDFRDGLYRVTPDTKIKTLVRACWLTPQHWLCYDQDKVIFEDGLEGSPRGGDDYTCPAGLLKVTDRFLAPKLNKVFYPHMMEWSANDPDWRDFSGRVERDVPQAEWDAYHLQRRWGREDRPPQELIDVRIRLHVNDWVNLRDVNAERVVAGMRNANGLIVRVERAGEYRVERTEMVQPPRTLYKIITNGSWGRKEGYYDRVILKSGFTVPVPELTIGLVDFYDQEIIGIERVTCTR